MHPGWAQRLRFIARVHTIKRIHSERFSRFTAGMPRRFCCGMRSRATQKVRLRITASVATRRYAGNSYSLLASDLSRLRFTAFRFTIPISSSSATVRRDASRLYRPDQREFSPSQKRIPVLRDRTPPPPATRASASAASTRHGSTRRSLAHCTARLLTSKPPTIKDSTASCNPPASPNDRSRPELPRPIFEVIVRHRERRFICHHQGFAVACFQHHPMNFRDRNKEPSPYLYRCDSTRVAVASPTPSTAPSHRFRIGHSQQLRFDLSLVLHL